MLNYPTINNVAFKLGPVKIYWYGIMYLLGFAIAWLLAKYKSKRLKYDWTNETISDLIFYCALGVIIGGRIGYVLFYAFSDFIADPLFIFKVWHGGMSFHGGAIGVAIALFYFAKKTHSTFFTISDFLVPLAPLGIMFGRIGNFINGELAGRVTTAPWGMIFPNAGTLPRHPSQLYEAFLEGLVLFLIVWIYSLKPRPRGATSGLFLLCYGVFRIICEFFREPDIQLGFIAFDWLTMGQLLSSVMIIAGLAIIAYSLKHKNDKLEK